MLEAELVSKPDALAARNALRMTLKDLYLEGGDKDQARTTLLDMLRDNAAAQRYYPDMLRRSGSDVVEMSNRQPSTRPAPKR
jgi:hypothetical protein